MRLLAWAALAACICPAPALAAPQTSALATNAAPAAEANDPQPETAVRVALRQETLAPGASLPEHRPSGERYLYVIAGRLKVADLVTGEEQVVEAGGMAAEKPGDWHVAVAVGGVPATFYVIDRGSTGPAATAAADHLGN